ncbi:uncharacterized protein LOC130924408 [Corythoichthys intestinalis]|uniref:uncharacterized protein LOC130924408 n=1 Tax=Corythoichthys intestinalis TaxID=161448 RepID=UPI0025A4DAC3|nr:uncharacterized protein LOC130924408 [Corythoichthys intestinalis]
MDTETLAILWSLESLSKDDYDRFCFALVDRRPEPRVSRRKVENKPPTEVARVLVATYTAAGAPAVVSELLRRTRCLDEAKNLACSATDWLPAHDAVGPSPSVSCNKLQRTTPRRRRRRKDKERMDVSTAEEHLVEACPATYWCPVQGADGPSTRVSCERIQQPETRRRMNRQENTVKELLGPTGDESRVQSVLHLDSAVMSCNDPRPKGGAA